MERLLWNTLLTSLMFTVSLGSIYLMPRIFPLIKRPGIGRYLGIFVVLGIQAVLNYNLPPVWPTYIPESMNTYYWGIVGGLFGEGVGLLQYPWLSRDDLDMQSAWEKVQLAKIVSLFVWIRNSYRRLPKILRHFVTFMVVAILLLAFDIAFYRVPEFQDLVVKLTKVIYIPAGYGFGLITRYTVFLIWNRRKTVVRAPLGIFIEALPLGAFYSLYFHGAYTLYYGSILALSCAVVAYWIGSAHFAYRRPMNWKDVSQYDTVLSGYLAIDEELNQDWLLILQFCIEVLAEIGYIFVKLVFFALAPLSLWAIFGTTVMTSAEGHGLPAQPVTWLFIYLAGFILSIFQAATVNKHDTFVRALHVCQTFFLGLSVILLGNAMMFP